MAGMWGNFQRAAEERMSTADLWSSLRSTAAQWSLQTRGLPPAASLEEERALGSQILSEHGITGPNVSVWRGESGAWLRAKEQLHALGEHEQITSNAIYTPPWAQTSNPGVPSRYRIRTQWVYETAEGETEAMWRTDELTTPLTSLGDIFRQAEAGMGESTYLSLLESGAPPSIVDYEIEQV